MQPKTAEPRFHNLELAPHTLAENTFTYQAYILFGLTHFCVLVDENQPTTNRSTSRKDARPTH